MVLESRRGRAVRAYVHHEPLRRPEQRGVTVNLVRRFPSVSVIDIGAVLDQVRRAMDRAALAVQYVFLFTLAAGIMVLLAAIQATRDERMFESAVLRTLGARRSVVLQGVAAEFTALGLLAGTLAAVGAGEHRLFARDARVRARLRAGPRAVARRSVAGAAVVGISGTLAVRSVVNQSPVATLARRVSAGGPRLRRRGVELRRLREVVAIACASPGSNGTPPRCSRRRRSPSR